MRQNFKMYLALCIFFSTLPKAYSQVHPEWLEKVQIFQSGKGYVINPSPIMSKVTFTGQGWLVFSQKQKNKSYNNSLQRTKKLRFFAAEFKR